MLPLGKGQASLLISIEDLVAQVWSSSQVRQPTACPGIIWSPSCHFVEVDTLETGTNADAPATVIAVSKKLSFVSGPGVLCLLLASMKQLLTKLLACK